LNFKSLSFANVLTRAAQTGMAAGNPSLSAPSGHSRPIVRLCSNSEPDPENRARS